MKKRFAILLSIVLLLGLAGCAQPWDGVTSIGNATAGNKLTLEPIGYQKMPISVKQDAEFKFKCKTYGTDELSGMKNLTYTTDGSQDGWIATSTYNTILGAASWEKGAAPAEISFTLNKNLVPSLFPSAGEGYFYFYLTDSSGACVSNIVKWPVSFQGIG